MDSARSTIVARVAELGLSLSELSLKVGKNHAYFQQFIKRGVPNRLPEEVRGRVAEILGLDELALRQPTATHLRFMLTGEPQVPIRGATGWIPSEEHTSELQSHSDLVCRLLLEKKKINTRLELGLIRLRRAVVVRAT